ncbi:MAG: AgmX/PglI C-terminal domain-containing protein [Proteobacteria bacterium]|nr:AgmX/PglI C-terminal domain-containing protein [Pseudomonadota bacterium]
MAARQPNKNLRLRIGVFRGKNVLEERVVNKNQNITFGKSQGNTFFVSSDSFPKSFEVFVYDVTTGCYTLSVPVGTKGRVVLDEGKNLILESLDKHSFYVNNDKIIIKLGTTSRGKVIFGKITILFQFVSIKEDAGTLLFANRQQLKLTDIISLGFLLPLIFSLLLHCSFLTYVLVQDWPRDDETIAVPNWFKEADIRSSIDVEDEKEPEPEPEVPEDPFGEATETVDEVSVDVGDSDASKDQLLESITDAHREAGAMITAQILGIEGDSSDYFGAMLGSSVAIAEMTDVSASDIGAGGTGSLLGSLAASSVGGDGNGLLNIGQGASSGPRVVTNDTKKTVERKKVSFTVKDTSEFTASAPAGSKEAIEGVFKKKKNDINNCYNRVINAQGKTPGRFVLTIAVGKDGSVMKVEKVEDQIGGEMFSCVRQRIMSWKFGTLKAPMIFKKTWIFN